MRNNYTEARGKREAAERKEKALRFALARIFPSAGAEGNGAFRRTVLVTAFEPFGEEQLNPTEQILAALDDAMEGYALRKLVLPVEFDEARRRLFAEYDSISPAAVVMLGQAGGRSAITPETTGKNRMDARIPDNAGKQPRNRMVAENGPDVLFSTFPAEKIVKAVREAGVPCELSGDAGTYVCNTVLYGMLAYNHGEVPTGFIHVPFSAEQGHGDKPCLELNDMVRGIAAAVRTVIRELDS